MHVNLVYFFIVFSVRDGTETKYPSIVFLSIVQAGFHAILTCGLVSTSFQVGIEIYDD